METRISFKLFHERIPKGRSIINHMGGGGGGWAAAFLFFYAWSGSTEFRYFQRAPENICVGVPVFVQ